MRDLRLSVVVPVYNEEQTLRELWATLTPVLDALDADWEVVFVDDASIDATSSMLAELHERDPRCKILRFSRNFGHQIAVSAGLDHAAGDAVVVMDADLQDPPELIPDLVARWQEGYEVVYAVRGFREGMSPATRAVFGAFYRVLHRLAEVDIPLHAGDFRLIDRVVVETFRRMPERSRYVRGMISWAGFRQVGVPYRRPARVAGTSKYSLGRRIRFALSGIISFSTLPLRISIGFGAVISTVAFVVGVWAIVARAVGAFVIPGWASVMVLTSFLGGVQLLLLGVLGLYVGNVYEEVKGRPLYVIRESVGIDEDVLRRVHELAR
jgi:polyisoprenyl-phosphate glycosyltransferase